MLSILGGRATRGDFCDGLSRRDFLRIGGLTLGGLSLPGILRAEAQSGTRNPHKGIINIFLPGGPPHQDMWDLKPDAPREIRGEFSPIATNVPGVEICELFPRLAAIADRLTFIRSLVGAKDRHYAFQCQTGWHWDDQPQGGWPALGSAVSYLRGPADPGIPAYIGLAPKMGHMLWSDNGQPGFLGLAHAPFTPNGEGKEALVLNGVSLQRLDDRRSVLAALDRFRRGADLNGSMDGLDAYTQQAFGILTSSRLAEALDLDKEDPALRARYGRGTPKHRDDGGPELLDQFLLARRLIEAGARCVSLAFSRWDWHGGNFKQAREVFPMLDQGTSALVEDLETRGMLDDVTVIVWGEMGRTPKINGSAGRDHWPQVCGALLAGGGLRHGRVIGATNRLGEVAIDRPVHFQDVFATMYHALGIDVERATLPDLQGRPQYLIDNSHHGVIRELA
ncbi:MAG: DUF1501 domain-containing protein [Planctomycetaceae bacterium]